MLTKRIKAIITGVLSIEENVTTINREKFFVKAKDAKKTLDFVESNLQEYFISKLGEGEKVTYKVLSELKGLAHNNIEHTENKIKTCNKELLSKVLKNSLTRWQEELNITNACIEKLEDVFAFTLKADLTKYVREDTADQETIQEYKHQHKDSLCHCCNKLVKKDQLNCFTVKDRNYGSIFDTMDFTVQLCPHCAAKIKQEWFDNSYDTVWGYNDVAEKELWNFLNTFRIENQEYIFNTTTEFEDKINRYDWIEEIKEEDQNIVSEKEQNNIINLLSYIHNFTC